MTKEEAKKELEFYKNLASNHEAIVKGCNEKIIELQAIINKPDRWQDALVQPEKEKYFYLMNNAYKGLDIGLGSETKRKPEHAFKTQEQAELIKNKMLLMQEMHAFAHVRNQGWMPDWGDEDWVPDWKDETQKWGLSYNAWGILQVYVNTWCNDFVFGIAVKSKAIAEEMMKEFGERIEKFYNKQY